MKKTKTYQVKSLFPGAVIGKEGTYVAIPNKFKDFRIEVLFNGDKMIVENWLNADGYRKFPDKFGRKDENGKTLQYTLGYFLWQPVEETGSLGLVGAMAKVPLPKNWEELGKKLHG